MATPRIRIDLNLGTLGHLPEWSTAPRGEGSELYHALKDAGFEGVQGGDPELARTVGLACTAGGGYRDPATAGADALALAERHRDAGFECTTLHLGTGFEDDDAIDRLVAATIEASERSGHPLYIETHRATITTDIYRTVRFTERHPAVRFNGDFSHWYTGHEMRYGDWEAKLAFIRPVLERCRYFHGRIGNPSHMQVDIGDGRDRPFVDDFREIWTRSFVAILAAADAPAAIGFAPELLPSQINYARLFPGPDGELREETDRFQQALVMADIVRDCWAAAEQRAASLT